MAIRNTRHSPTFTMRYKKQILASLLATLCATSYAQTVPTESPVNVSAESSDEVYGDYFHIPIWGLVVGKKPGINRPSNNNSWLLVGAGGAVLKVSPANIDFGSRDINETFLPTSVTLQNVGARPLTFDKLYTTNHQYSITDNCDGATLPPLGTCIVNIGFTARDGQRTVAAYHVPFSSGAATGRAEGDLFGKGNPLPVDKQPEAEITPDEPEGLPPVKVPETTGPGGGGGGGGGGGSETGPNTGKPPAPERPLLVFPDAVVPDTTTTRTIKLKAGAGKPLRFYGASTSGSAFAVTHDCPTELAPGQECSVTGKFTPRWVGEHTGTLTINSSNYSGSAIIYDTLGEGIEYYGSFSQASTRSLEFGTIVQNYTPNKTLDVEVINDGFNKSLKLLSYDISSIPLSTVQLTDSNKCFETEIAVGASCTFKLSVPNHTVGSAHGLLTITHNGKRGRPSPTSIVVSGAVVPQQIEVTPDKSILEWGDVERSTYVSQTIVYKNTGNAPFAGMNASVTGEALSDSGVNAGNPFSVYSNGCSGTIAPGGTCSIVLRAYNTTSLVSNATGTLTLAPRGTVHKPIAAVPLTARIVDRSFTVSTPVSAFGLQSSQRWNGPHVFNFQNTGNIPLTFTPRNGVSSVLSNGYDLTRSGANTCIEVAPGASCTWSYYIKPISSSSVSYTHVFDPLPGVTTTSRSLATTMQGTPQTFEVETQGLELGDIYPGETYNFSIKVTNTSDDQVSLTGGTSGLYHAGDSYVSTALVSNSCTTTLAAGASCQIHGRLTAHAWGVTYDKVSNATNNAIYFRFSGASSSNLIYAPTFRLKGGLYSITPDRDTHVGQVPSGVTGGTVTWTLKHTASRGYTKVHSMALATNTLNVLMPGAPEGSTKCVANQVLMPGDECVLLLRAYPLAGTAALANATATLNTYVSHGTSLASLSRMPFIQADIVGPTVSFDKTSIDFERVGASTSEFREFIITPTHGGTIKLSPLPIRYTGTGISSASFAPPSDPSLPAGVCSSGGNVATGKYCAIRVTMSPGHYVNDQDVSDSFYWAPEGTGRNHYFHVTGSIEAPVVDIVKNNFTWDPSIAYTRGYPKVSTFKNSSLEARVDLETGVSMTRHEWLTTVPEKYTVDGEEFTPCFQQGFVLSPGQTCAAEIRLNGYRGIDVPNGQSTVNASFTSQAQYYPLSNNWQRGKIVSVDSVVFETPIQSTTFDPETDKVIEFHNDSLSPIYFRTSDNTASLFSTTGEFYLVDTSSTAEVMPHAASYNSAVSGNANGKDCLRGNMLPSQGKCTLRLRFAPTGAQGERTGTVTLATAHGSRVVNLSGTVYAGNVYMSSNTLDFGPVPVDQEKTLYVTIGNGGLGYLDLSSLTRNTGMSSSAATYPAEFTMEHNCPRQLPAGEECVVAVTFTPDRNLDFGALSQLETVRFSHKSSGVFSVAYISLKGISFGSNLSSSLYDWNIGEFQSGVDVDATEERTITYTASDISSVTIHSLVDNYELIRQASKSTCTAGLRLEPGDTCTLTFKINPNMTASNLKELVVMNINGDHVDENNTKYPNGYRRALLKISGVAAAPLNISYKSPNLLSTKKATDFEIYGAGIRANLYAELDGIRLPTQIFASESRAVVSLPTMTSGVTSKTLKLKFDRPYGYKAYDLTLSYESSSTRLVNETGLDVYTFTEDAPVLLKAVYGENAEIRPLPGGNWLVKRPANTAEFRLYNSAGRLLDYVTLPAGSHGYHLSGNSLKVVIAASIYSASPPTAYWDNSEKRYYGFTSGYFAAYHYVYDLSSGKFTRTRSVTTPFGSTVISYSDRDNNSNTSHIRVYGYLNNGGSVKVLANGSALLSLTGYYTTYKYDSYYGYVRNVTTNKTPTAFTTLAGITMSTGPLSLTVPTYSTMGTGNNMFVRQNGNIYSFTSVGDTFTPSNYVRYAYTDIPQTGGIAFLPDNEELITPCQSGRAICGIPTNGRNLGAMSMMLGSTSTALYTDGSAGAARISGSTELINGGGNFAWLLTPYGANKGIRSVSPAEWDQRAAFGVTRADLDFGSVAKGSSPQNLSLNIGNVGGRDGYVVAVRLANPTTGFSIASNNCGGAISAGSYCTVEIKADTATSGVFDTYLVIDTISSTSQIQLPVSMTVQGE